MKSRSPRRSLVTRAGAIVALVAMTGVVPLASPAGASTYYASSSTGYDASYPQGTSSPPSGASFAIIGVTHGRPFTTNQYASAQWTAATKHTSSPPSLYFNTGYALAYAKSDTTNCKSDASQQFLSNGATGHTLSALQAAWAIGCSEADWAMSVAPGTPGTPVMWWADVETGNSWSKDTALNQATITGMASELAKKTTIPFGIYSTPSMWTSITGSGFVVATVAGDWQAGLKACSLATSGFTLLSTSSTAPLLVAQTGTTTGASGTTYDKDVAC